MPRKEEPESHPLPSLGETIRRIKAHLVRIERQLRVNEAYARDAGCGDVVET